MSGTSPDQTARQCPLCKSPIHPEARRCPHCTTDIDSEGHVETTRGGHVVYVLDRDLIRFLKLAGSTLAIFALVGVVLFGVDLEKTAEEVEESAERAQAGITELATTMRAFQSQVDSHRRDIDSATQNSIAALQRAEKDAAATILAKVKGVEAHAQASSGLISAFVSNLQAGSPQQAGFIQRSPAAAPLGRMVYDLEQSFGQGKLARGEGDPPTGDATVDAVFEHLGVVHRFFAEVLGRNSIDDRGMPLIASVHAGESFSNAYWDGRALVLGDGDGTTFTSFAALDVIASELGHALVEYTATLQYRGQSGALNEHFSDVLGVLVEQWNAHQNVQDATWLIGETIVGADFPGTALRSVKDPGSASKGDDQPNHMSQYRELPDTEQGDYGGVHLNGGIPNRAFYQVSQTLGGFAWERAGKIWFGSLAVLHSTSNFQDAARVTLATATQMFGESSPEVSAVREGWASVGIDTGS